MSSLDDTVREFLACERIAVAGVSRDSRQPANAIYRKLRASGRRVAATNPRAEQVEGDPCYANLRAVPGGVDAVVVAVPAAAALGVVLECRELGIRRVWLHRGMGAGSVAPEAVAFCREHGLAVIPGACPMMYLAPVDVAHRCMRMVLHWFGRLPHVEQSVTDPQRKPRS
jgi:uncharacterized protein